MANNTNPDKTIWQNPKLLHTSWISKLIPKNVWSRRQYLWLKRIPYFYTILMILNTSNILYGVGAEPNRGSWSKGWPRPPDASFPKKKKKKKELIFHFYEIFHRKHKLVSCECSLQINNLMSAVCSRALWCITTCSENCLKLPTKITISHVWHYGVASSRDSMLVVA